MFPIGQQEGLGHVIDELKLNNEKIDTDFVLSKSNIKNQKKVLKTKLIDITKNQRIDFSDKNSFMFKGWNSKNSPILPIIHLEKNEDKTIKLWIHTTSIAERLTFNSRKSLDTFFEEYESFPLIDGWHNYLNKDIIEASKFNIGQTNEAISICLDLDSKNEVIDWSFHLTKVKCSLVIENKHLEAILTRKSKTRISSRILKPIKEYIEDLDKILEIAKDFREKHKSTGKFEIDRQASNIESLNELFVHNPADYIKEYLEPLNNQDINTYLSPILFEANLIWFNHSSHYNLKNASYIKQNLDYLNISEIIKNADLLDNDIELNQNGSLTFGEILNLSIDTNKNRILHKLLLNSLKDNEVKLITKEYDINNSNNIVSPWTMPSFDFINLINQYNIYSMITCGKRSSKANEKILNINEKGSIKSVKWDIFNASTKKNIDLLFNNFVIDKINEHKNKVKKFKYNIISIKQVRKAEKLIGSCYEGLITSVQSYGFFVEIPELNVEGSYTLVL